MWFSGGHGSDKLMVDLYDFKGLFQPKWFYDSMKQVKTVFYLLLGCI